MCLCVCAHTYDIDTDIEIDIDKNAEHRHRYISKCVYTHRHKQEGYGIYSSCHGAAECAECSSSLSISHAFTKPGLHGRHGLVPSETEGHDS